MRNPPSTPLPERLSQSDQAEYGLGKSRALEADQEPKVSAISSGLDSGASGALRVEQPGSGDLEQALTSAEQSGRNKGFRGLLARFKGRDSAVTTAPAAAVGAGVEPAAAGPGTVGYWDIFKQFVWLGWTAFGGPSAHIGLFQKCVAWLLHSVLPILAIFVEKLSWVTSVVFLELLGLAQCLPGPTSTQVSFALGVVQKGIKGGLLSGVLFQYPGLIIAALAGAGAANFLRNPDPWLRGALAGLAAVGVALIASAAKALTYSTCKDMTTMIINAGAAVISFYYPATYIFPACILAGGLITLVQRWKVVSTVADADRVEKLGVSRTVGAILILIWALVLTVVIVLRRRLDYESHKELYWFEAFYRTGSIIFGGGQVVLPLLQNEVVNPGWVSLQDFLTGFALVQAMPGPLFNISAYLGAVIAYNAGTSTVGGILLCWVALFSPGIILIYGFMPWWGMFRNFQIYRRMLPGLNAAAVGLIVEAVFLLTFQLYRVSPFPKTTICIGIIGFSLVDFCKCPAPLAVLSGGVLGIIGWAAHMK